MRRRATAPASVAGDKTDNLNDHDVRGRRRPAHQVVDVCRPGVGDTHLLERADELVLVLGQEAQRQPLATDYAQGRHDDGEHEQRKNGADD